MRDIPEECSGCIMINHHCHYIAVIPEARSKCPCLKCIVKVVCTFDDVCDDYAKYSDIIHERFKKRIEQYETCQQYKY